MPETSIPRKHSSGTEPWGVALVFGTVLANLVLGYILGAQVAPSSESAPLLSAFLLAASFGLAFKALEAVALLLFPLLLVRWVLRWVRGSGSGRDAAREDERAGWFFLAAYVVLAALSGLVVGAFPDGWGMLSAAALYGGAALLLGVLTRRVVLFLG